MAAPLHPLPPDTDAPPALIAEAVAALGRGELIALPTETVYGLAARADDPAALERLARVKGRDPARAFTWHAPDAETVLAGGPRPRAVIARLARRYWPGPLTLVLADAAPGLEEAARDGWTGVRVPAHDGTRALLAACDFPVVATSANPSGGAPLLEARAVQEAFGDDLALVLDGGPARLAEPSAVLAVGPGRFEVLREGLLEEADMRATAGRSLLFVCTGNTCRSPMAAGLARELLRERLGADPGTFGFTLGSAGVSAGQGAPAAAQAIDVMAAEGIDLSSHASRPARTELVEQADHVYCLTAAHREVLLAALPPHAGDHVELLDPDGRDVADPVGAPVEVYHECARALRAMIARRVEEWA